MSADLFDTCLVLAIREGIGTASGLTMALHGRGLEFPLATDNGRPSRSRAVDAAIQRCRRAGKIRFNRTLLRWEWIPESRMAAKTGPPVPAPTRTDGA